MDNFPYSQVIGHASSALDVAVSRVRERSTELFASEISSAGNGYASPFQKILFPEGKIFSSFERSLSASLGKAFDYIATDIARAAYGNGEHDYSFSGNISTDALQEIERIVNSYKNRSGTAPSTVNEIQRLLPLLEANLDQTRTVKTDVYFVDHEGFENYLEIKTPMPNYDTCAAVKTRILTIRALRKENLEKVRALAVFPHNPNGIRGVYAWPPTRYFLDPETDWKARGYTLMGEGLWNFIGNSASTYDLLLEAFYEVSVVKREELMELLELASSPL